MKTRELKYVIVSNIDGEHAILSDNVLIHNELFNPIHKIVVSAGFVVIDIESDILPIITVYGESLSLKLKSRPEDADIIKKTLFPTLSMYGDLPEDLKKIILAEAKKKGIILLE